MRPYYDADNVAALEKEKADLQRSLANMTDQATKLARAVRRERGLRVSRTKRRRR